jgi:hypothetical protein
MLHGLIVNGFQPYVPSEYFRLTTSLLMIMAALIEQVRLEFPTAIVPDTAS